MSRRVQNRFALTLLLVFVFLLAACGTVGQLKGILEAVEANEPRAQGTRYGANYNRLRNGCQRGPASSARVQLDR